MSIWCSFDVCGADEDGDGDGTVISYIRGWSNHYPEHNLPHHGIENEVPASVGIAWIPPWCVPGHEDSDLDESDALAPWLRLDLSMHDVSIWPNTKLIEEMALHSVILNEGAVRKLRDHLTDWLDTPKLPAIEAAAS